MSKRTKQVQPAVAVPKNNGVIVMTVAVLVALSGVFGFALLAEESTYLRAGVLVGCLIAGCVIGWFSQPGKDFVAYCRASYEELRRVVWPTRKETVNTTGLVCGFVVIVAFFLFLVDNLIQFVLGFIL
ncbi:MAG: preprotein translocase subunit SecE [Burkholderiales bacterium]|nr:preprotein translocase subunit SecE [Burkholderiales bacterium]